jgi:branched-subunit amino acid ABC-type transport system permease component
VSLALQIVISGLAAGGVYGVVAIAYTLIYRLTGVVHFALGELIALAVFVTLLVAAGTGPVTQTSVGGGRFALALVVGLGVCVIAGTATYALAIKPYLDRGSTIGWVAVTVAIAFAIRAILGAAFDRPSYVFPDPFPFRDVGRGGVVSIAGASVQVRSFFVLGLAVVLAIVATWVLERTRTGRGLQAIASDQEGAHVVGIPVERLVAGAFGAVGGLAAIAAIAAAPSAPFDVDTGTLLGLKGLVAAVVVRFASPWRAFAAGLALGLVEAAIASADISGYHLGPEYREVLPIAVALIVVALQGRRQEPELECPGPSNRPVRHSPAPRATFATRGTSPRRWPPSESRSLSSSPRSRSARSTWGISPAGCTSRSPRPGLRSLSAWRGCPRSARARSWRSARSRRRSCAHGRAPARSRPRSPGSR